MNCKQGDIAIVVRSQAGNEGKIVRCLQLIPAFMWVNRDGSTDILPSWEIDIPLKGVDGDVEPVIADNQLRPIRPGDISDDEVRDLYAPKVPEAA
jgi:hypothetical protein